MLHRLAPWLFLCSVLAFALGCSRGSSTLAKPVFEDNTEYKEDPKAKEIRDFYQRFKAAVIQPDPDRVLKLTDGTTLRWMESELDAARTKNNKEELGKLDLQARLFVIFLRQRYKLKQLKDMDAKKVLEDAYLSREWIAGFDRADVAVITMQGDNSATATSTIQPAHILMEFRKMDGEWKYRFEASHARLGDFYRELAKSQLLSDDEFLLKSLRTVVNGAADPRLLDGPIE
jgi:hypothetical protein